MAMVSLFNKIVNRKLELFELWGTTRSFKLMAVVSKRRRGFLDLDGEYS